MCAIVAPTGIAAFNVGGLTIHRLFQLPIEHEGKTAGYWALSKEAQKRIKITLKNLKIIIVDEVSM
uniref:ATP-dependent DNA helicase n=1 Tax=Amphimedon queenslandica TaxID=400682 RepID=A0A1X7SGK9_AMPQE